MILFESAAEEEKKVFGDIEMEDDVAVALPEMIMRKLKIEI